MCCSVGVCAVADPSGSVIPGASLTATNVSTGVTARMTSDDGSGLHNGDLSFTKKNQLSHQFLLELRCEFFNTFVEWTGEWIQRVGNTKI